MQRQQNKYKQKKNKLLKKQRHVNEQVTTIKKTRNTQEDNVKAILAASDFADEIDITKARLPIDDRNALRQQQVST